MEIDDGVYAGVFIVTQIKKTLLYKTVFHLCALDKDEFWVRLRRNKKQGVVFRPLRRIVAVKFIEPSSSSGSSGSSSSGSSSGNQMNHTNTILNTDNSTNNNAATATTAGRDISSSNNIVEEESTPASLPSIDPQFSLQLINNISSDEEE